MRYFQVCIGQDLFLTTYNRELKGFPGGTVVKNLPVNARRQRDASLIPGPGRYPGIGNSNLLQYSSLENSMVGYSPWGHKELN